MADCFSTQLGVIEDFGSPKAGSDSEVVTQASVESLPSGITHSNPG
jgi:hypothetical protein